MQKLIQGIHHFQSQLFGSQRRLFERLAAGQQPEALFITCSDSRINPNLITHTDPGELFIVRNAGNIVPPFGANNGGEGATIEFAVVGLGVQNIVVCGHSLCGAMKGLLTPASLQKMPTMAAWLKHAERTRLLAEQKYTGLSEDSLLNVIIQENVLAQLENLRTIPCVAAAIAEEKLKLHGWVYKLETGEVFAYDPEAGQFLPVTEASAPSAAVAKSGLKAI